MIFAWLFHNQMISSLNNLMNKLSQRLLPGIYPVIQVMKNVMTSYLNLMLDIELYKVAIRVTWLEFVGLQMIFTISFVLKKSAKMVNMF